MPRVRDFHAFREKTLTPALPSPRECGAPALGLHPSAETVLVFARPFRWLIGAFHPVRR